MKNWFILLILLSLISCKNKKDKTVVVTPPSTPMRDTVQAGTMADAATILSVKQVPVLCYHRIKNT
jgi:hypothetical protein